MLKIRLQRTGKRGQAYFRVVVLEHTSKPKGKYLEFLGSYDPHKNELSVKADRVKHWLSVGAHLSETANNLLVDRGIIEGEKVKVWKPKLRRSKGVGAPKPAFPVGSPTEASVAEASGKEKESSQIETPAVAGGPKAEETMTPKEDGEENKPAEATEEPAPAPAEETAPSINPAG